MDATGSSFAINGYDSWGVPNPGNMGRFQYTGQAWLPEIGLYHYKARVYSPKLGRFLQTDPIGYEDQINLYAYVTNDPVNSTDPTGMEEEGCTGSRTGVDCDFVKGSVAQNARFRQSHDTIWSFTSHASVSGAFANIGGEIQIGIHIVLTGSPDIAVFLTTARADENSINVMVPSAEIHVGSGNLSTDELRRGTFDSVNVAAPYVSVESLYDAATGEHRDVSFGMSTPYSAGAMTTRPNTHAVGIRDAVIGLGPAIDASISGAQSVYDTVSDWISDIGN